MTEGVAPVINSAARAAKEILDETSFRNIYTGVYKDGPVRRVINFHATTLEDAKAGFTKYIKTLDSGSMNRINQVGSVVPFALNLEDEIKKFKERQ